jgi:peroxiredoxin
MPDYLHILVREGFPMKRALKLLTASAFLIPALALSAAEPDAKTEPAVKTGLKVGQQAPDFKIKDAGGKLIDLAELTAKGPVLVRLTCGCSGCDKELGYFQALHEAYKGKGLTSLAVFKEPDARVESYVKEKKLQMLYAVDTDGNSWSVFETKTMPTNFLIDKGGTIRAIAAGCDPSGLVAQNLSEKVAKLVGASTSDVQGEVKSSGSGK